MNYIFRRNKNEEKLLAIVLTSILGVGSVLTGCGPKEEGTDKKR